MEEFSRVIKSVVCHFNGGYFGVYICQTHWPLPLKSVYRWFKLQFSSFAMV